MARGRRMPQWRRRPGTSCVYHWSRDLIIFPTAIAAGAQVTTLLFAPGDYAGNTVMSPSGVTLVRTILDVTISMALAQVQEEAAIYWAIVVADSNASVASIAANSGQNMTDERVLANGFRLLQNQSPVGEYENIRIVVDTKQKVKLRDANVNFVINADAGNPALSMGGSFSMLVMGDIT